MRGRRFGHVTFRQRPSVLLLRPQVHFVLTKQSDYFLSKYNSNGGLHWVRSIGASGGKIAAVAGSVYVTGTGLLREFDALSGHLGVDLDNSFGLPVRTLKACTHPLNVT